MDNWTVSILGLLWVMLLWTFMCKFLYGYIFSSSSSIHILEYVFAASYGKCLIFWGDARLFPKEAIPFYISTRGVGGLSLVHITADTSYLTLILDILVGVKWYLTVFWLALPWWIMMLNIFSCGHWLFVFLLWRNVYSSSLSIF